MASGVVFCSRLLGSRIIAGETVTVTLYATQFTGYMATLMELVVRCVCV